MANLKFRFLDDDKVIAEQKGQRIEDFDNIFNDLKVKYNGKGKRQ